MKLVGNEKVFFNCDIQPVSVKDDINLLYKTNNDKFKPFKMNELCLNNALGLLHCLMCNVFTLEEVLKINKHNKLMKSNAILMPI